MPGRGCQTRKQERRNLRKALLAGESPGEFDEAQDGAEGPVTKKLRFEEKFEAVVEIQAYEPGPKWVQVPAWIEVSALENMENFDRDLQSRVFLALYEACAHFGNAGCTYPQLVAHPRIQEVKEDPGLENVRVHDMVKMHTDIFQLTADSSKPGGWLIQMKPGVIYSYPDTQPVEADMACMPDIFLNPTTDEEKLQALRIHVVRSVHKRGDVAVLHDLGQDPDILELKREVLRTIPVIRFVRSFPENFALTDLGNGNFTVELMSPDVSDLAPLQDCLREVLRFSKGKGKLPMPENGIVECREFHRGQCKRGDDCRFSHGQTTPQPFTATPQPFTADHLLPQVECREFARGGCKRGDACRFSHGPPLLGASEFLQAITPLWDLSPRSLMPPSAAAAIQAQPSPAPSLGSGAIGLGRWGRGEPGQRPPTPIATRAVTTVKKPGDRMKMFLDQTPTALANVLENATRGGGKGASPAVKRLVAAGKRWGAYPRA